MRSLSVRLLLSLIVLFATPAVFAHDVTISGTQNFASLDGSSSDHDAAVNGVFTVNDGNLVVNGVVNCNDDTTTSACSMAFAVSGNMTINSGGALYAENRSGGGTGGAITLTVGGNLALNGTAIVSTASKSSSGSTGGAVTANVGGTVALASGTTIDSGASNAAGGAIVVAAGGAVSVDGNVLSGPSRTILSTRLTGVVLDGGTGNSGGGAITIGSSSFAEPAVLVGADANIVSQGSDGGAGPVTLDGCGIQIRGLVAALSRKDSAAKVSIRSGKDVLVDGRDLGGSGTRMGRVRADAPSGTALNKGVDIFAAETIDLLGPSGSLFAVTSIPGLHDSKSYGGLIRVMSLGDAVNASGNVIDDGHTASGDSGGTVQISAKGNVNLNTAVIRAVGDFSTNNSNRGGGSITVRSYSGDVIWTNGTGDVRPVGSTSGLPLADQGSIVLTACGTVNTTGSSFPVNGTATSMFPETHTGVCSPAAPSLPSGVPALITCNTPPVANDGSATTNEDTTVTITLTGSDADGDPLTFSIVSGPSNGTLGAIIPTGPTSATVDYSPNFNYFGGDSFVFRADDGNGGTDDATITITVNPVNDPPSFQIGPTVTVLEDSGAHTITPWVTSISPGPANESSQTVSFTTTNNNNALFSVQPFVASNGTLTFTLAANANGSAIVTVTAQDNGGTANGGNDTSAPQTSTITVTAVNDAPSFTSGGDVTVNEDSGAYSAAWATAISAGPANESGQTLTFTTTNDNNALFSVQPTVSSTGVLSFTLAANANGSALVSVTLQDNGGTANGGVDSFGPVTFTITVTAVNDAPSFTSGGNVTVNEDSGAYSAAWATAISAGPANESGQTLTFTTTNNNNALFSVQPSIAPDGTLSFTPALNANGSATVSVTLQDNGGTANSGDDTSPTVSFTISVTSVNVEPSLNGGGDVTVNEDSGAYSAAWATAISSGPANESGQTVNFVVSNNNNALFLVQPSISSTGVLTFTPALNANGSALVTVTLHDNGGIANGGVDTSAPQTFTIYVTAVNDGPTAGNDAWETFGNTELRVDLAGGLTPRVSDTTPSGNGVRDNDTDPEGDPMVVTGIVGCSDVTAPFDCTLGDGSKVSMLANGSFSYTPGPGNTTGSFQYTVTDIPSAGSPATSTGTVTITIHEMIWYVNGSAAPGGNGTSIAPLDDFTSLNGAGGVGDIDGAGDYIFVHTSAVTGSIYVELNQKLWGEGYGLSIAQNLNGNGSPTVLVAPGVKPVVTSSSDVVTANRLGIDIAGLSLSSATGNAIDVTTTPLGAAAGVSIHDNVVTGAGQEGIDVNGGTGAGTTVNVNNTSITSSGHGFSVTATAPAAVSYSNGTILSTGGTGIFMDGSAGSLTVTGLSNVTIDGTTAGAGISVNTATFDAVAGGSFNTVSTGSVTVGASGNPVGGAGVSMTSVSGDLAFGTLTVFGGTSGVTIGGSGLYTGSTGMRVTNGAGSISAPAGVGLSVTNATIGAGNLNFTSISATGAANGILLNNTGTSGGLTVTGTGAADSGGTIQNVTGDSVSLTSTQDVSLTDMQISNSGDNAVQATGVVRLTLDSVDVATTANTGILGTTVTDFKFRNGSTMTGAGNAAGEHGIFITDLFGANSQISASSVTGSAVSNVFIINNSSTAGTLTISNSTLGTTAVATGGDAVSVTGNNTANLTVNLTGGNTLNNSQGDGIQVSANNNSSVTTTMNGATSNFNGNLGSAINVAGAHSSLINATISGFTGLSTGTSAANGLNVINIQNFDTSTINATVSGNTITGLGNNVSGIRVFEDGNGTIAANINGNSISGVQANGIVAQARLGTGLLSLTISANVINLASGIPLDGISIESGSSGGGTNTVCLNMFNNTSSATGQQGYRLRQRAGTTFNLQNFAGSGSNAADITTWVNTTKSNTGTTDIVIGTAFSNAPSNCVTP
jgi:hypothetical protein